MPSDSDTILVTGATGYIGGRLVPRLLGVGCRVRCLVRDAGRLRGRSWLAEVEVVEGDVLKPQTLARAVAGVSVAYYLIHMSDAAGFHARDLMAARSFGEAAGRAGVTRIIYLGGLGDPGADLSPHLRSRQETGAAMVIGVGSVSFEVIRYLTERLPVLVCPKWVYTRVQPVSTRNVLDYLVLALDEPDSVGKVVEIGGSDVLTYGEMMTEYARVRGLRRLLLPVPALTPSLSAYWVHWMTPVPAPLARPLIEGLRKEAVVRDCRARKLFPQVEPMGYLAALDLALHRLESGLIETAWSDALWTSQGDVPARPLRTEDGILVERRYKIVNASADEVHGTYTGLGGRRGWLCANWAWIVRGRIDRLIGGVGLRRGRRQPDSLREGDAVDFWRVEAIEPGRMVRFRAEMKVPGLAWLQFESRPHRDRSLLVQTAFFVPKGLWGLAYWYLLYPIHAVIFSGMVKRIGMLAERARQ